MTHSFATVDFLDIFPEEICELIFDNLPLKDLVDATLVSKQWNDLIGNSKSFKKRAVVNVSGLDQSLTPISVSARSYEIISIRSFKVPKDLNKISNKQWKKVFFNIAKVKTQKNFKKIITSNFSYVKDLKVMNVSIKELSKGCTMSLAHLESLVFSDIALDVFEVFIDRQPNLKSLSCRFIYKDIGHPSTVGSQIEKFLQLNSVVNLELYEDVANEFFKVDVTQSLKLNLRSLAVNLCDTKAVVKTNLETFIKSQGASLLDLRLGLHQRSERQPYHSYMNMGANNNLRESTDLLILFNSWNSLISLEKLTLRFFKSSDDLEIERSILISLKPISSLKEINIQHNNCQMPTPSILALLKYAPNIRTLYITKLTLPVIRFFALNFNLLRRIKYAVEEGDCKKEYLDMISANKCDNKFIKISQAYLG